MFQSLAPCCQGVRIISDPQPYGGGLSWLEVPAPGPSLVSLDAPTKPRGAAVAGPARGEAGHLPLRAWVWGRGGGGPVGNGGEAGRWGRGLWRGVRGVRCEVCVGWAFGRIELEKKEQGYGLVTSLS